MAFIFKALDTVIQNLAAYVGEYVLIRYNPNDMAEIRVFIEMNFFVQQYLLI